MNDIEAAARALEDAARRLRHVAAGDYSPTLASAWAAEAEQARSALAHAARGEGEWQQAVERALGVEHDEVNHTPEWARTVILNAREIGNRPTPPPATGEANHPEVIVNDGAASRVIRCDKDHGGSLWIDAEGCVLCREEAGTRGERERFLAWWDGDSSTDYAAFPGENTKCVAYAAWCGRARALPEAREGGRG